MVHMSERISFARLPTLARKMANKKNAPCEFSHLTGLFLYNTNTLFAAWETIFLPQNVPQKFVPLPQCTTFHGSPNLQKYLRPVKFQNISIIYLSIYTYTYTLVRSLFPNDNLTLPTVLT